MRLRLPVTAVIAVLFLCSSAPPASAQVDNSEWAFYFRDCCDTWDGVAGNMIMGTDILAQTGRFYGHFVQVAWQGWNEWLGIGTTKGAGTSQGHCTDHYGGFGAGWTGYYDYQINGVYECRNFNAYGYLARDPIAFQIAWKPCTVGGPNRWVFSSDGVVRACVAHINVADLVAAGLETGWNDQPDFDIDVCFNNMTKSKPGNSTFGDFNPNKQFVDPNYAVELLAPRKFNAYLPPLAICY